MGSAPMLPSGLTIKESKFIKKLIETGNATTAAESSYNVKDRACARHIAAQKLKIPRIKEALNKAFVKHNLTPDTIVGYLK